MQLKRESSWLEPGLLQYFEGIGTIETKARHAMESKNKFEALENAEGSWVFVPDGWTLVPETPTEDMLNSGAEIGGYDPNEDKDNSLAIYTAMLTAAPPPAAMKPKRAH